MVLSFPQVPESEELYQTRQQRLTRQANINAGNAKSQTPYDNRNGNKSHYVYSRNRNNTQKVGVYVRSKQDRLNNHDYKDGTHWTKLTPPPIESPNFDRMYPDHVMALPDIDETDEKYRGLLKFRQMNNDRQELEARFGVVPAGDYGNPSAFYHIPILEYAQALYYGLNPKEYDFTSYITHIPMERIVRLDFVCYGRMHEQRLFFFTDLQTGDKIRVGIFPDSKKMYTDKEGLVDFGDPRLVGKSIHCILRANTDKRYLRIEWALVLDELTDNEKSNSRPNLHIEMDERQASESANVLRSVIDTYVGKQWISE